MEGGSDVEIEEHVSSFSVRIIASIASLKLGKSWQIGNIYGVVRSGLTRSR